MGETITFTVQRPDGITQVLLKRIQEQIKEGKAKLTDDKITNSEFEATLNVLDEINADHQKRGESIFKGGTQRNELKSDWHKNYVVYPGQIIEFTEVEMDKLYKAMGVELINEQKPANVPQENHIDTTNVTNPRVPVDTLGIDTLGIDTLGVDTLGIDTLGVDTTNVNTTTVISQNNTQTSEDGNTENKNNAWKWIVGGITTALLVCGAVYLAKSGKGKAFVNKVRNIFKKKNPKPGSAQVPGKPTPAPVPGKPTPAPVPAKPTPAPTPAPVPAKPTPAPKPQKPSKPTIAQQHRQDLANGDVKRTTPNDVRNINVSNTDAKTRKMVEQAFEGEPTPAQIEEYGRKMAYQAPTVEERKALEALEEANKAQRAELNNVANIHTGASVEEIYKAASETQFKPGLHTYTLNKDCYVIDVDAKGNVIGILREAAGSSKAEYLNEIKIAKFLDKHPDAIPKIA